MNTPPIQMKPMIIIPYGTMDQENIKMLRENGICVVIAKDPGKVRFVDPIPAASSRTQIEQAAIKLSRIILNGTWSGNRQITREDACKFFFDCLVSGTPLDLNGTPEEREAATYRYARDEELRKLAREDAKKEREERKKKTLQTEASKLNENMG